MKIGSSFDTRYKYAIIREALEDHDAKDILVISKTKFHFFCICLLPYVLFLLVILSIIALVLYFVPEQYKYRLGMGLFLFALIGSVIELYKAYVSHWLDFIIVTPEKIDIHNQRDLFHKNTKSIYAKNIAGIHVSKDGFWDSIFNQGRLTIEEIGEDIPHNKVYFGPVYNPDGLKNHIEEVTNIPLRS